ncbi:hypothetical protein B0T24DRAFT_627707 [Lasiosphaeria ovina]|uniref:Uncharacterized protein n=1 Tax=Lasiosphaeria ovina TaxID=92902 RepID=A0AAE0K6G4_9PEZI|nr:hypothetical protein B0T24DRAFT_627707 [Lasiosphaeria ovina]
MRAAILRTVLADWSFTTDHRVGYPLADLLDAYDGESSFFAPSTDQEEDATGLDSTSKPPPAEQEPEGDDHARKLRQFLREAGELASGKRIVLSSHGDIGLGFSTVRKGDVLCIILGSKLPCVLRRGRHGSSSGQCLYRLVGQCYLDGWMDGDKNPRGWWWWEQGPESFVLL